MLAAFAIGTVCPVFAAVGAGEADSTAVPARYRIRFRPGASPVLEVRAFLPAGDSLLQMARTRPADLPELGRQGWPVLVRNMKVEDGSGRSADLEAAGPGGWRSRVPVGGPLEVAYAVDYSLLAAHGWPAPREGAFADSDHFVVIGRSIFVSTPEVAVSTVDFELPPGWRVAAPWQARSPSDVPPRFSVPSRSDLEDNLLVFTRSEPDSVAASRFRLLVTPLGAWESVRPEIRKILRAAITADVRIFGSQQPEGYLVVLLPLRENGGESFRNSFALTREDPPSAENRADWGNTIAHEIFHYWNGSRLRGADYASSQWFQEGFTEYFANLSLVSGGAVPPEELLRRLADHIERARQLATGLEEGGSHKGPPLYGAGALVAFSWDLRIRAATQGKRNLADFMRALWARTGNGGTPYTWDDIQASLEATAPGDWAGFYNAFIRGKEPLPIDEMLSSAGLRLAPGAGNGALALEIDPSAPAEARSTWQALVSGR